MAKKTFEAAFELGEKVLIVDHDITGVINSILISRSKEIGYQVEWANLAKTINAKYFHEAELGSLE